MKLTIGMIVKNEEKWIDKCLSAIKPILDNVDCELIVTDTGSTDKTVELAKKYTDKVFHFDWINDFAAARNFGLEKAKGEWFMMLDADDIFRSCENIIEFFNSGDYKKYNAASYISRNLFKTETGDSWEDLLAPRMVRIQPHTKYVSMVHEYLTTFEPPYKNINDIADHYGYYYETKEDEYRKFKRNSELLLKRYETEKDTSPMLCIQLYESFMGIKDYDKALFYLNAGVDLAEKLNSGSLPALYFHKASYYQTDNNYETAVEICDKYFNMSEKVRPAPLSTDGEIYAIKAVSLYKLEKYADAVVTFKKFFDTFRDIESGKLATYDRYLISTYLCSGKNFISLFNIFCDSCIKVELFNTADSYMGTYPLHKYSADVLNIKKLIRHELTVAEHFSYKPISKYYKKLSEIGRRLLIDELFERAGDEENRDTMYEVLTLLAKTDNYIADKLSIYKGYFNGIDIEEAIAEYIAYNGVMNDLDLLGIAFEKHYDISSAFAVNGLDIKQCAYLCCKNIRDFYKYAENYDVTRISDDNVLTDVVKFYEYCIGMRLVENEDKSEEEKNQLIGKLLNVKNELNKRCKKQNATTEFLQLAATIKRNIRSYIDADNSEAARKTLEEYRQIAPDDPEIAELLKMIG